MHKLLCWIFFVTSLVFAGLFVWQYFQPEEVSIWDKKVTIPQDDVLKIGVITDTHVDTKRRVINGVRTEDVTDVVFPTIDQSVYEKFVPHMQEFAPDFMVHVGDVIDAPPQVTQEIGIAELELVKAEHDKIDVTTHWVIGNHDLRGVSRNSFLKTLGQSELNYSYDYGEYYRFIFVDSNFNEGGIPHTPMTGDYNPGRIPKEVTAWLTGELETDRHVYVFIHHNVTPPLLTNGKRAVLGHEEVRALFSEYNVSAVFNGHIERRIYREEGGVKYFVLPGTRKAEVFKESFYDLTLSGGDLELMMYYTDEKTGEHISEPFITEGKMVSVE